MQKKILLSLSMAVLLGVGTQVYANSTIYTDDLGRLHFLGKDPGAKTLQKIENYDNPAQKDLTNVMYKDSKKTDVSEMEVEEEGSLSNETPAVNAAPAESETPVADTTKGQTNKSKGTFTYSKGAMDASDPYTYGNTNLDYPKKDETQLEDLSKKRFWQIW